MREQWNNTSGALLCKETLNRNENVTFMHSAFHSFPLYFLG